MAEEYYATTAYLTREPTLLGSVIGQDRGKILLLILIIFMTFALTVAPTHPWVRALYGVFPTP
jgi:hypothetical protein